MHIHPLLTILLEDSGGDKHPNSGDTVMAELQTEPLVIGQALLVSGTVRVESVNGVSQVLKPNSSIHLDDRIDTGSGGEVSIVLNDSDATQLDLGRMSQMIVDDDVLGGSLPDLGDVAVEAGLVADLWQDWESFEPVPVLDTTVPETDESGAEQTADTDSIPGLDGSASTVAASDSGDDGLGSIDDDLDMTNLIPPPDDAA